MIRIKSPPTLVQKVTGCNDVVFFKNDHFYESCQNISPHYMIANHAIKHKGVTLKSSYLPKQSYENKHIKNIKPKILISKVLLIQTA